PRDGEGGQPQAGGGGCESRPAPLHRTACGPPPRPGEDQEVRAMKSLHVAVLMGGWSAEREVSLNSGAGVADALEGLGHTVTRIDMGRDVAERLRAAKLDLVFNA